MNYQYNGIIFSNPFPAFTLLATIWFNAKCYEAECPWLVMR
jgi:hypothetical protein